MKGEITVAQIKGSLNIESGEVREFLSAITPQFIKDTGGLLSDQVKGWRFSRWIDILSKADQKVKDSALPVASIELKTLLPIAEQSSLEAEEPLQDKWANLLANAATGNAEVMPNFAEILKDLTPMQAKILDHCYEVSNSGLNYTFSIWSINRDLKIYKTKAELLFDGLSNKGLIRYVGKETSSFSHSMDLDLPTTDEMFGSTRMDSGSRGVKEDSMNNVLKAIKELGKRMENSNSENREYFKITALGQHFTKACRWEVKDENSENKKSE